jgi:SAM-dependent methyltransferase
MNETTKLKEFYQEKYKKYGNDPKSLLWSSKGAAHQRFRQVWAELDFEGKSVLDVGCGFGELAKFIAKRAQNFTYRGIDIVPEFIEEARKQFPQHEFDVSDYLTDNTIKRHDIVVASGILNSNVEDNDEYRKDAIKKLYNLSTSCTVFNMLGAHPQPQNEVDSNVWYADSLEILEYCMSLTHRVIMRHHYHPTDFTVFLFHPKEKK